MTTKIKYDPQTQNSGLNPSATVLVSDDGNGNLTLVNAANPLPISGGGSAPSGTSTQQTLYYAANTAFTSGSVNVAAGDTLAEVITTASDNTKTTAWYDQTQNNVLLTVAPTLSNLTFLPNTPLTLSQLQSAGLGTNAALLQILAAIQGQGGGVTVIDSATPVPALYWMITDNETNTVKYYIFGTTTIGTPVQPVKPYTYEVGTISGTVTANLGTTDTGNLATTATSTSGILTQFGTSAISVVQPTGGAGLLGWVSGIFTYIGNLWNIANDTYGTGTVTSSSPAQFSAEGRGTVAFQTSGTWTGSIIVEYSMDGVSWYPTTYTAITSGGIATQFSSNTGGQINTVGFDYVRLRSNTIASGSASVQWFGSRLVSNVMIDNALTVSLTTGTAIKLTDGTSTAAIAPASTPATATQTAQVVAFSPNTPLPAGTNPLGTVSLDTGSTANLLAIAQATGTTADAAYSGTGNSTIIAALKAIYAALTGSFTVQTRKLTALNDAVTATVGNFPTTQAISAASLPLPAGAATAALQPALNADGGALAHITNLPATQAISAASLPLPANAATETGGNLAAINTATGAASDAAYSGSGNSSIIAALKGIYTKLGSVVLAAGTAIIGKVGIDQTTYGTTNAVTVGATSVVQVTPTVTVGAYTAGQVVGGLLSFGTIVNTQLLSGLLQSAAVQCKINYTSGFKLTLFTSIPSTTFTDKTTPNIGTIDAAKWIDELSFTTPIQTLGTACTFYKDDLIGSSMVLAGQTLYGVLTCIGAPTFATTSDVTVTLNMMKD